MSEVLIAVGDADPALQERLDEEISTFNATATGHHDGRLLSAAVRGDDGELRAGLYGWPRRHPPGETALLIEASAVLGRYPSGGE